ncbi:CNH domain-containing protein [Gautieria morchelliformis]|nr:CNH domain-containing protein [Gautieria morchelliformis]
MHEDPPQPPMAAPSAGFREIFEIRRLNNNPLRGHTAHRNAGVPGVIACTMPFVLANDRPFVAIGCSEGIWVVDAHDPDFLHRVMELKGVTGFAVIEEYQLLLVLADKALYCFSLDALDPFSTSPRVPQKLTGSAPVDFFRVGIWTNSLVIIYKRKRMTESIFHVLEPVLEPPPVNALDPVVAYLGSGRICYFRPLKEFFVPVECTDLVFLRSTISLLHPKGFEILDLETFSTATIPSKDTAQSKALAKRCKGSKPLGLFRAKAGGTSSAITPLEVIEWHGTVFAVAPVSPYVVLFKARSIEVRQGSTGRLEQVLFGSGVRCSWRGPGVLQGELDEDDLVPESANQRSRMQVVMNAPHGMGPDEVAQHVYDLVLKGPPPP